MVTILSQQEILDALSPFVSDRMRAQGHTPSEWEVMGVNWRIEQTGSPGKLSLELEMRKKEPSKVP